MKEWQEELQRLNALPADEAEAALLACCGSSAWARQLVAARPFRDAGELFEAAGRIWRELEKPDWLEAFSHHPRIGEKQAARATSAGAQRWSEEEQARSAGAATETLAVLREANLEYQARFGYIFIVCATGKSQQEMLAILRQRLQNDPEAELHIAAGEQRRITHLRLEKLLQP